MEKVSRKGAKTQFPILSSIQDLRGALSTLYKISLKSVKRPVHGVKQHSNIKWRTL